MQVLSSSISNNSYSLINRDPNSLFFYYMLRENFMTFSRGIPELYISSNKDILLKTTFCDWMPKFVARRRAIASNQVLFEYYCFRESRLIFLVLCQDTHKHLFSMRSAFLLEVGSLRRTATPEGITSHCLSRIQRTMNAAAPRSSHAAYSCTRRVSSKLKPATLQVEVHDRLLLKFNIEFSPDMKIRFVSTLEMTFINSYNCGFVVLLK